MQTTINTAQLTTSAKVKRTSKTKSGNCVIYTRVSTKGQADKNMLSYVKKSKQDISCIIVYSVDRFFRSGANAIYIAE